MANIEKRIAEAVTARLAANSDTGTEPGNINSLSLLTGIPYNTLKRRLASGRDIAVEELYAIAEALGVEVADLLGEAEASSHKEAA